MLHFFVVNILILANKFIFPAKDGYAVAVFNMVRGLSAAGHSVVVLCMNTSRHYGDLNSLPDEVRALADWYAVDIDTEIRPLPLLRNWFFTDIPYHVERFSAPEFSAQLRLLLEKHTFDVVQLEGLYFSSYIPVIRQYATSARVVMRAHNLEHEIWARMAASEEQPLKKIYFTMTASRIQDYELAQFKAGVYDGVVAITDRDAGKIKKIGGPAPIWVTPVGFDLNFFVPANVEPEFPSVFYIGALDWMPNQQGMRWFLKFVWPRLHSHYPDVPLYLAGRNMPDEFKGLDGANGIRVLGEVEDAYTYMLGKSIMVVPLQSGGGMRVKLIEGMALGKMIVATQVAAEGIPVKHGVQMLLAGDTDHEAFANHVAMLIEDKAYGELLARNALKFSQEKYDNRILAQKLTGFYQSLIEKAKEKPKE